MTSHRFRVADTVIVVGIVVAFTLSASATSGGLLVASWASGAADEGIKHYDENTGAFISTIVRDEAGVNPANDFALGPDGMLYAAHFDHIRRHDPRTTDGLGTVLVSGGLGSASDIAFGPADGKLYVSSPGLGVLRYDSSSGALIDTFVAAGSGGLSSAQNFVFHNGDLYLISGNTNQVLRYDGDTGAFVGVFATASNAVDLTFGPDGDLFIATQQTNVRRHDGTTGAFEGLFTTGGPSIFRQSLTFGPGGDLYVGGSGTVQRYDGTTGAYEGVLVPAGTGLAVPTALAFVNIPEPGSIAGAAIMLAMVARARRSPRHCRTLPRMRPGVRSGG